MFVKAFRAIAAALIIVAFVTPAQAQTLCLRHPAPSPDGSRICFSYQGDLWVAPSQGGKAERLTVHVGYDSYAAWSPDGKSVAFSSDRYGSYDVFVIPVSGGDETRLTWHSADDIVAGWSPDSRRVLFEARRDNSYEQIWEIPVTGGREKPLTQIAAFDGAKSADNEKLIFTRGAVPWWRKGYRGSAACDIFSKNLQSGKIERLTFFAGNDLCGALVPGSAEMVYLSDSTGNYNLFRRNLVGGSVVQITNHRLDVHHPRLSADGSLIAYELGGEIFLYDLKVGQGRKLQVEVNSAAKTNDIQQFSADSGLTEFVLAPNATSLAYVVGGEVFCRNLETGSQRILTATPCVERDLSWSEDSQQLAFVAQIDGSNVIQIMISNDPRQLELSSTHEFFTTTLIKSDQSLASPRISPMQTRIAFIRGETQLVVTDIKKLTERALTENNPVGDFSWSPDGRYLVFTQRDGNWDNELYIGDSESGSIEKISDVPGRFRDPHFSDDGKLIYYLNEGDLFYLYLDRQLGEMSASQRREYLKSSSSLSSRTASPVAIDFETIATRSRRVTDAGNVLSAAYSAALERLAFATSGNEVLTAALDDSKPQLLTAAVSHPQQLAFLGESVTLVLSDAAGRLFLLDSENGRTQAVSYRAEWNFSRRAQFQQMFADIWREISNRFYDESYHGANWETLREEFLARVQAVSEAQDFQDLMRELLGQINASHLNLWSYRAESHETGLLGVVPEYEENSAGLKVIESIPGSPASKLISEIKPFDKITAIGGVKLDADVNLYAPLTGKVGHELKVDLINRAGLTRSVILNPISVEEDIDLRARWRELMAVKLVDQQSQGKIGYLALRQITAESVAEFENSLKKMIPNRQALLIDLRGNSGGSEHDRLLELLSRRPYIKHDPRYGESGADAPWAFSGPIALLVDEYTSSDGEIVAQGFRELGLGEIIGVTTYGAVIGTEKKTLADGSTLSVPTVGWRTLAGQNLENHGVSPDIAVPLDLDKAERGEDNQLVEAVARLLGKLK